MRLIEYPLAAPGHCLECGYGGRERKYADTGLDVEFYGVVYVCELCLVDWMRKLDFDGMSELRKANADFKHRIGELERERGRLLDLLRTYMSDPNGSIDLSDEKPDQVVSTEGRDSANTDESGSKPRSNDVRILGAAKI